MPSASSAAPLPCPSSFSPSNLVNITSTMSPSICLGIEEPRIRQREPRERREEEVRRGWEEEETQSFR